MAESRRKGIHRGFVRPLHRTSEGPPHTRP